MGYAFVTLIASGGNVNAVEQTLLIRGLLSPAGHMAWTGLACGALWATAAAPTGRNVVKARALYPLPARQPAVRRRPGLV